MKTLVVVEVHHDRDLPDLANKIAGRAYTLDGVRNAEAWVHKDTVAELERAGFTLAEISLGATDVVRG